ncbi:MAG: aspartate/glutamate racemase family protein, partial [Muribaculaceae bacterium]|nr:aspartate/glutamate racemase family protein [Muribaculaceae bacterium]
PEYDYLYLGDNARAPYGSRSFEVIYRYTFEAVRELFARGCPLVILACNTASAKALRTIQQKDLPDIDPTRRVLGVIRPTVEILGDISVSGHVGVLGTPGTVASHSYLIETTKLFPEMKIVEQACPLWVPIVENSEADGEGADYFVRKYIDELMDKDPQVDTFVLACTHYPLLIDKIRSYAPDSITILEQGRLVAESLKDYLKRHPEMECRLSKDGKTEFLTSENPDKFDSLASVFTHRSVKSSQCTLD